MKKIIKLFLFFTFFLFSFCLIFEWIPIKRSIDIESANKKLRDDDTYLCWHTATTGPPWEISAQEGEMPQLVCLEGNTPFDFYFAQNTFLIQGEKIGKRLVSAEGDIQDFYGVDVEECDACMQLLNGKYECYDIIYVTKWEIIGSIDRGDSFRIFASSNYMSIFDFIG